MTISTPPPTAPSPSAATLPPLRLRGVGRLFGATPALAGIDLDVEAGELVLLVGANGSGKSTLLRLAALLLRPSAGEIRFGDDSPATGGAALRARIGYLGHRSQLHGDLSAREALRFAAALHGLPAAVADRRHDAAGLEALGERPLRRCSRGQLQRVALVRTLLGDPAVLLLDEPTAGLDEAAVAWLRERLAERLAEGAALLAATHEPDRFRGLERRRVRLDRGRLARGPAGPPP